MGYFHCTMGYKSFSQNLCFISDKNESFAWIMEKRASNLCVTTGMIRAEALRILANGKFSASNGWLDRFMKRNCVTIHRITTSGVFSRECEPYIQMDLDRDSLLIAEKASIHIDPSTRQSVYLTSSRRVDAVTTGRQRISRKIKYLLL
jgi:hypothetical protein